MSVDRPIIFSAPMVRALLAGSKTQTRRLAWGKPWQGLYETNASGALVPIPRPSPWQRVQPGDRLWVKESGAWTDGVAAYAATDTKPPSARWRPSIHMPRWASRITLRVEAARVERLQDISGTDALAEGITPEEGTAPWRVFLRLWNSLHGEGAWQANPEVVVIQFRVDPRNIDATARDG